ncbi:glycosyltransferase [Amylibacter sp.]|nr:glycosyltransferase [Amylibacter sp.]
MKIVHLISSLSNEFGGPAKSVPHLVNGLNKLGYDNILISPRTSSEGSNDIIEKFNLKSKSVPASSLLGKFCYSRSLYSEVEKELTTDAIIHIHTLWTYPALVGLRLAKKYKLRVVVSARGMLYAWALRQGRVKKSLAMVFFQKNLLKYASVIHVTEPGELSGIAAMNLTYKSRLVPNGIDLAEFARTNDTSEIVNRFALDIDKKHALFMSRIDKKKGLIYLVRAWIELSQKFDEWDLVIAGPLQDKKYYQELNNLIVKASLEKRVHWLGMLNNKERLSVLGLCDLCVLPSYSENFGIVIAEGLAAGLPVITTHGTPWSELDQYNAGWWIELSQSNVTAALSEALNLPKEELFKKGIAGRSLAKNYSWDIQASKMAEVYEEIFDNGHRL